MLGFAFGLITLIAGITGADYFTFIIFSDHPIITTLLCIGKATLAGVGSAYVYKLAYPKNKYVATFLAAGVAPLINTGLFIIGSLSMSDTLSANFVVEGQTVIYFLVVVCAGINFLVELAINLIVAPGLHTVYKVVEKSIKK